MSKQFEIVEVNGKKDRKEFLMLPVRLYEKEKNWIRPLDKDIEKVFDKKLNKFFRHGECTRWIIKDETGKTIGRVAAFIDKKQANKSDQLTGGMGFFECINDNDAAFALFDKCKKWLKERKMEAMNGPVNFGERNEWWGLLKDGFLEPNYGMPYNFHYYNDLFEAYGFKLYYNQFTYHVRTDHQLSDVVVKKAEKILLNPDYSFRHLEKNQLKKYTEDFRIVYNKGWAKHAGVSKMSSLGAKAIMRKIKPILEERLLWYAYYKDEPVAFFLMLPELNQIFKHVNGKLNLIGKLKYLYHKKTGTCKKMLGTIFGVVPEHQAKGVESAIVVTFSKVAKAPGFQYTDLEMNWIGDFNPKMMHVAEQVGGKILKTHITYRYLFDRNIPFQRMPTMQ
ncbi:MAG: hypothetical protein KAT48_05080 [Bacteroidales bacterium]|nr:hypothetical protein [Bacteroidales bacterium]